MERRPEDEAFERFRRTGAPEELGRVFDLTAPGLLLVATHLAGDVGRAEDVVQSTFLQALRDAERHDGRRPVGAWLAGILGHRALDARRREGRRAALGLEQVEAPPAPGPGPLEAAAGRELVERVAGAIAALDEPYRQVLVLRLVHGLEPIAIAHALGRAPGTVRMQLQRGLGRLRRALPREASALSALVAEPRGGLGAVREAVLSAAGMPPAGAPAPASGSPAGTLPAPLPAPAATMHAATGSTVATLLGGTLVMKVLACAAGLGLAALLAALVLRESGAPASSLASAAPEPQAAPAEPRPLAEPPAPAAPAGDERSALVPAAEVAPAAEPDFEVRVRFASDGSAAEGVGVYLRPAGGGLGIERVTDAGGSARFAPPPGEALVLVDRLDAPVRVDPRAQPSVAVEIPAGARVVGRVVDLEQRPIPGATILVVRELHPDLLQPIARADERGEFSLRDVPDETSFVARAPGYQPSGPREPSKRRGTERAEGSAERELELRLGALGHVLRGRVVREDGSPEPHAWIAIGVDEDARRSLAGSRRDPLVDASHKNLDRAGFFVRADGEGRFATDEVPAGHVVVLARPVGGGELVAWEALWVRAGEEHEVLLGLRPGARVHGTLRDPEGRPLPGLRVEAEWEGTPELGQMEDDLGPWFTDPRTVSDADGAFELTGLLPGEHDLRVRGARDELAREERELAAGESVAWDPVIVRHGKLRVRLFGPDGRPLVGWGIVASDRPRGAEQDARRQRSDAEGRCSLADVAPGPLHVRLWAPGPDGAIDERALPAVLRSDVLCGEEELELRLAPEELPTAGLAGRCVGPGGAALAGARLVLVRTGWRSDASARCGEDGSFAFVGLSAGPYELFHEELDGRRVRLAGATLGIDEQADLGALAVPAAAGEE